MNRKFLLIAGALGVLLSQDAFGQLPGTFSILGGVAGGGGFLPPCTVTGAGNTVTVGTGGNRYTFITTGNLNCPGTNPRTIRSCIIAGGGGGGGAGNAGGGGGGGGMLVNPPALTLIGSAITPVVIGAGGTGGNGASGTVGNNSAISISTAFGGGFGSGANSTAGGDGGSGGGGVIAAGGAGSQGAAGGTGAFSSCQNPGGGGGGGPQGVAGTGGGGGACTANATNVGSGGAGSVCPIDGVQYAGGGGPANGQSPNQGPGGAGGGVAGARTGIPTAAGANTGGGAGGSGNSTGGVGGSGKVIVEDIAAVSGTWNALIPTHSLVSQGAFPSYTHRTRFLAAGYQAGAPATGKAIRVTVSGPSGAGWTGIYCGHADASASPSLNYDGNQVPITVAGSTIYTLGASPIVSDIIPFPFNKTRDLICESLSSGGTGVAATGQGANYAGFAIFGNQMGQTTTGSTGTSGTIAGPFFLIEVFN